MVHVRIARAALGRGTYFGCATFTDWKDGKNGKKRLVRAWQKRLVRAWLQLCVTLAGLALILTPASADSKFVKDADDASGRLDIKSISHGHSRGDLIHRINTYNNWRGRRLRGRTVIYLWFSIDKEDRYAERRVVIDFVNGRLGAWLQTYQESSDHVSVGPLRRVDVRRRNRHNVAIFFRAPALVGRRDKQYAWSASTRYKARRSDACRGRACVDWAPGGRGAGRVRHRL